MKMGFFIVLGIALLANVYVLWHVYQVLPLPTWGKWTVVALMTASLVMMFTGIMGTFDRMPLWMASATYDISTSWLIVFLYLLLAFVLLDLGRLVHIVPKMWLHDNAWTAGAITAVVAGLLIYGNLHYHNKVREPLELTTAKQLTKPVKVVMLSDLHLGYHNRRAELARWVDIINAEKPDLVLIGGDIVDMSLRPVVEGRYAEEFRRLQAPIYTVLGNHEYYSNEPQAERFFRDAGIILLKDSVAHYKGIDIVGRDDRTETRRAAVKDLAKGLQGFTILLDHQPYHLEEAEQAGIDFQFSGHTHRGQVWPASWVTDAVYEKSWGHHQRGHTRYYVSSGLGIWGPKIRVGTRSEYLVLHIKKK